MRLLSSVLVLLALLGLGAVCSAQQTPLSAEGAQSLLLQFIQELQLDLTDMESADAAAARRRLLAPVHLGQVGSCSATQPSSLWDPPASPTSPSPPPHPPPPLQDFHAFLASMLGADWAAHVPPAWASPSFDWAHLGTFEYSSKVGEFFHGLHNLTLANVTDPAEVYAELQAVEDLFCTPEE